MNEIEYFLAALAHGNFRYKSWVHSAFTRVHEGPAEAWLNDPQESYPYRLVQSPTGVFYVDPNDTTKLLPLVCSNYKDSNPPLDFKAKVTVPAGALPNLKENIETTYGRLLFNATVLCYAFGDKIPYMNHRVDPKKIESIIEPLLTDDPEDGSPGTDPKLIYVSEYLRFADAMFYMAGFAKICVPGLSEKAITPPPGIKEKREQLLEQYKDRLSDPTTAAIIGAELVKYDAEYLKGDSSEGFLIGGKSRHTVRRKLYLMYGAEPGLEDKVAVDIIPNSLTEGWDVSKFSEYNNSLRAGSFNRGAQTVLGGETVKWLLRASSNLKVVKGDCGTRLGMLTTLTEAKKPRYLGFSVVTPQGSEVLTEENYSKYINKRIMVRSPMYCKMTETDFCEVCVGPRLSSNPTAISAAVTNYGNVFLYIFMSAAHAKSLTLAEMDLEECFI